MVAAPRPCVVPRPMPATPANVPSVVNARRISGPVPGASWKATSPVKPESVRPCQENRALGGQVEQGFAEWAVWDVVEAGQVVGVDGLEAGLDRTQPGMGADHSPGDRVERHALLVAEVAQGSADPAGAYRWPVRGGHGVTVSRSARP